MYTTWIRALIAMRHEAMVAMWMPMVDSASFMTWKSDVGGLPTIASC